MATPTNATSSKIEGIIDVDEWAESFKETNYNHTTNNEKPAQDATETMVDLDADSEGSAGGKAIAGIAVIPEEKLETRVKEVDDLSTYDGSNISERIEAFIKAHAVVLVGKLHCPFCLDVLNLLSDQLGVEVFVINLDKQNSGIGSDIHKHIIDAYEHRTVPAVFCRGKFLGGCDDVKALQANGTLERETLVGLMNKPRANYTDCLKTAHLIPVDRSQAINPWFWFPNVVNNHVVRVTGFQVCTLSVFSAVFPNETWARYIAPGLLIDFMLRFAVGPGTSPLGMVATFATSPFKPQFKPGPPKQFASFCGVFFTLMATIFYFVDFTGQQYIGCAFMVGLACASGLEWVFDFCLGCLFFSWGIMFGIFPDYVYRIYISSKQETEDSWDYMLLDSNALAPAQVDSDPSSAISFKCKRVDKR